MSGPMQLNHEHSESYSTGTGGGISEAPTDGKTYGRKNSAWTEVTSGSSSSTVVFGAVNSNGTIANGTGFTVNKSATGTYAITFNTAYSSANYSLQATRSGSNLGQITIYPKATTGFTVLTGSTTGVLTDRGFEFRASDEA